MIFLKNYISKSFDKKRTKKQIDAVVSGFSIILFQTAIGSRGVLPKSQPLLSFCQFV